jgi:hypothetical protein
MVLGLAGPSTDDGVEISTPSTTGISEIRAPYYRQPGDVRSVV